ncbi:MAG TPA: hypothetical protein VHU82_14145 [Vicinamibacterales bacterium]|nr:hypothetical protein [Vicinamibacterales bacterium]
MKPSRSIGRFELAVGALLVSLAAWGCGAGYGSSTGGNPTAPSPDSGAVIINVVAINGAQSFSPNPGSIPAGQTVVWHNVDTVTHRVVLNDQSIDTGDLNPGTYSAPMTLGAAGPYHCSIHPEMIGSLNH